MKEVIYRVSANERIARDIYEIRLTGDNSAITRPGQFVNLLIDGCYLRRPLSVCNVEGDELTLIYKVVGKGTEILSRTPVGTEINTLVGLGNGFDVTCHAGYPLLVGGGVGVPPMYLLCRRLVEAGAKPTVVLGFNRADEIFYREKFEALGAEVHIATADGSVGTKGFVTDVIGRLMYTYFYACGPEPMFRAMEKVVTTSGEYSFEERMGCGFGACMGCSCKTKYGTKRICVNGPVLKREEVVW